MPGELATVLAYASEDLPTDGVDIPADARLVARDPVVQAHGTPAEAIDFARRLLLACGTARVAIHVDVLDGVHGPAVDGVLTLVAWAAPGEILVTDVVRQLAADVEQFEHAGAVPSTAGPTGRIHRVLLDGIAPEPPTVGRDVELASIEWVLDQLADGSGRALVFEGEAGIGKTHLVSLAAGRAAALGARVLRAEADELQPDRAGLVLERLLRQLPDTERWDGESTVDVLCERLERLAAHEPLLVIAEDLQWADPLSLRALAAVARIIEPLPIAVLADFRPSPRPPLLGALLDVFDRFGAEHHVLEPLDAEATTSLVTTLLGALPGPRLRSQLLGTAGNPLFLTEMLQALRDAGSLVAGNGAIDTPDDDIPHRLMDIVRRRLDTLPPATLSLVRDASLLGSTFELSDLEAIAHDDPSDVADLLVPAIDARLLDASPRGFSFRHDLVRESVQASMPEASRSRRHREIGWALAASGAAPVVVASQLVLGDQPDDPDALAWIERSARDARQVDPGSAVQLYEVLLTHAGPTWEGRELAEAAMIDLLAATGRVDEATERGHRLLGRPLDPSAERLTRSGLIAAHAARGRLEFAAVESEHAARTATSDGDRRLFGCITESLRFFDGRSTEALKASTEAIAGPDVDDERRAWAQQALGLAAMGEGRYSDAREHMVESRRLVERSPVVDLGFLIPHVHAPTMLAYLDDFDGQRDEVMASIRRWSARGETSRAIFGHISLMNRAYLLGELDTAAAEAEAALSVGAETGADAMSIPSHAVLALVDIARGELDRAQRHIDAGFEFLFGGAHRYGADLLVLAHAQLSQRRGEPGAAAAGLEQFWSDGGPLVLAFQYRNLVPEIVRLRPHGLPDEVVRAAIDAAETAATRTPIPSTMGCHLRCRGLLEGDPDLLLRAVRYYRESPRRLERAGTLEDATVALFRAGRSAEATDTADATVLEYRSMGADADAARVDELAREHGVRRRRGASTGAGHGWSSLTPKELEVADLVAQGLSNPEIGEVMFISRRTVESHLSHIFTKLGIPNRSKLTAMVVERRSAADT